MASNFFKFKVMFVQKINKIFKKIFLIFLSIFLSDLMANPFGVTKFSNLRNLVASLRSAVADYPPSKK